MTEGITLSHTELDRVSVIRSIISRQLTQAADFVHHFTPEERLAAASGLPGRRRLG